MSVIVLILLCLASQLPFLQHPQAVLIWHCVYSAVFQFQC